MKLLSALVLSALFAAHTAFAAPLVGTTTTALPVDHATEVIAFDDQAASAFVTRTIGNVTFSSIDEILTIDSEYSDYYNTSGSGYLDNHRGYSAALRFDFEKTVSAFAFNWGASDTQWVLTAFDATGTVLDVLQATITNGSGAGDYIGLAHAGIAYATLTTNAPNDWIFIDNFTLAAEAPEPGSLALLGLALGAIALVRARKAIG